jgi:hypothetical protein
VYAADLTEPAGLAPAFDGVEQILGRPALPFAIWATDHAADFA